ncbi:protein phosphatase [Lithospermum erythrorhizon]|uniref:Protein phosphatase n=1 Tax=Lithospermum erythrorhizon TaxID=34254 RepID=A0AAV3Q4V9_LITER
MSPGAGMGFCCSALHGFDSILMFIIIDIMFGETLTDPGKEIKVSFGYQCNGKTEDGDKTEGIVIPNNMKLKRASSSFSCLSGAAISANATLANTNICKGLFGAEILPTWDSPTSFRRIPSSPSISRLDLLSSSLQSSMSIFSGSPSSPTYLGESDSLSFNSMSAPSRNESFLNALEVQVAGGAAGEDRVQTVCSEENGWVFCGIYDGFNGRDAADFLTGTLYETIGYHLSSLDKEFDQEPTESSECLSLNRIHHCSDQHQVMTNDKTDVSGKNSMACDDLFPSNERSHVTYKKRVLSSLQNALIQAEHDFLHMVEQEMEDRPDLVSVGSCILIVLLHGKNLYVVNVGDSRAVLATCPQFSDFNNSYVLQAVQLTDSHTVDNEIERAQLLHDHPDDPATIVGGKVKGKLKVTRALGVGYLKMKHMNDALMGILRVRNLVSPPYVSIQPSMTVHEISPSDHFVVIGSDGLFDFFSNDEIVQLVHIYISTNPSGDPAKYLVEQLVVRAADCAGLTTEELMSIPAGRRRKYHDDVTAIVIILGTNKRTSKASICL